MSTPKNTYRLYVRDFCGFCHRVQQTIAHLGIDVEIRNIWDNKEFEKELVAATGRAMVPVLAIDNSVEIRWMPESGDIVRYLQSEHAG